MLSDRWSNDSQAISSFDSLLRAIEATEGPAYFVSNDNGSDANDGKSWSGAKATLTAAFALMTVDYCTLYVGGSAYTEALSTPTGIDRCKVVGVSNHRSRLLWQSGATTSIHLQILGTGWEFYNLRFHGAAATVPFVTVDHSGSNAGMAAIIDNCMFTGGDTSHSAIRFLHHGANYCVIKNNLFIGFYKSDYGTREATIWQGVGTIGSGMTVVQNASNLELIDNQFQECSRSVVLRGNGCLIKGNTFPSEHKTVAIATLLDLTWQDGEESGYFNQVVGNYFGLAKNGLTHTNGVWGNLSDLWVGNYCTDGMSTSDGTT